MHTQAKAAHIPWFTDTWMLAAVISTHWLHVKLLLTLPSLEMFGGSKGAQSSECATLVSHVVLEECAPLVSHVSSCWKVQAQTGISPSACNRAQTEATLHSHALAEQAASEARKAAAEEAAKAAEAAAKAEACGVNVATPPSPPQEKGGGSGTAGKGAIVGGKGEQPQQQTDGKIGGGDMSRGIRDRWGRPAEGHAVRLLGTLHEVLLFAFSATLEDVCASRAWAICSKCKPPSVQPASTASNSPGIQVPQPMHAPCMYLMPNSSGIQISGPMRSPCATRIIWATHKGTP
eukprot:1145032-Pelagomonas_calceolata.AAC.2